MCVMTVNVPSWLPFALGAVVVAVVAILLADAQSTPNSGELIVPERAFSAVTIG